MTITKRIDTRGGGHWYKLDGQKVDGVTTVIGNGLPKPALMPWAIREVSTYAATHLELLGELDEAARIDLLKGAPYRDRDKAARRGTEVHHFGEQLINGVEVEVPEELVGHVDSYLKFLDDWQVRPVLVEFVCGNRSHKWMGTADLIADVAGGRRLLIDLKTTRSGIFGEAALQLAAYRNAEFYLDTDGNEQPMIPVDGCAAAWIRADGADLVPVEAGPDIYRAFRYCQQTALFMTTTSKRVIGDVMTPPPKGEAA